MADNTTLPGTGEVYASDDIGGVKHFRTKMEFGADGSATDVAPDAGMPAASSSVVVSGSASALNADVMASTDVSAYRWVSIHITGTFSGTYTFQASNDNSDWQSISMFDAGGNFVSGSTATNRLYGGPIWFRYLRIRITSFSSGTVVGTVVLSGLPSHSSRTLVTTNTGSFSVSGTIGLTAITTSSLLTSAARTTTQTPTSVINTFYRGLRVVVDVTNAGTGSITPEIQAQDGVSSKWFPILTGTALTTNGTYVYTVYPGLTPVANSVVSDHIGLQARVVITANNANSVTYSVGGLLLP